MTPSELKRKHLYHHPESHFFDYENMRFFGDTMANYICIDGGDYWILRRERPVKHGLQKNAYFSKRDFRLLRNCGI